MNSRLCLLAVGLAALMATGCWDFNGAYQHYCSALGCDGGTGGGSGGGSGGGAGGGSGGGTGGGSGGGGAVGGGVGGGGGGSGGGGGGGGMDAGCGNFGDSCNGPDDCCPNADAGGFFSFYQGFPMGCSRLNLCQLLPQAAADGGVCRPRGYACHDSTECCNGTCNGGRCTTCGLKGDVCAGLNDCCYDQYSIGCDAKTGRCVSIDRADAGTYCSSSDMCADDSTFDSYPAYCDVDGGDPTEVGYCREAMMACTLVGDLPSGTDPCCHGLTTGTDGKCCLSPGQYCNEYGAGGCCTGERCQAGKCVPSSAPSPDLYSHCLYFQSCGGTGSGYWCDPISETCGRTFCFQTPTPQGKTGCCKWTDPFGVCTFSDNTTCRMFGNTCTTGADCCSGSCVLFSDNNLYCEYPAYY